MPQDFLPFTQPFLSGRELEYVREAIETKSLVGDGPYTKKVEDLISQRCAGVATFLTPSCTDALDMTALMLNLAPGDEVIIPGFTFTSTATAYAAQKATVVFADIDPQTLNIDPQSVENLITNRTRAIVVVNYAGVACDFDALGRIAQAHNLVLIEDNAHGFGGAYRDQALGSIGDMGTLSFHATKNIQCGEGGALLTRVNEYAQRAHVFREKGTNRRALLNGEVDKYTWVDLGSSFLTADYVAAFLQAQLEAFENIQARRETIWNTYATELTSWSQENEVTLPTIPDYALHTHHLFWLKLAQPSQRPEFMAYLKSLGIGSTFHYQSLAQTTAGKKYGRSLGTPISDSTAETLVRLPLFADMTHSDAERVVDAVIGWKP